MMATKRIGISGMIGVGDDTLNRYKDRIEREHPGSQVDVFTKEILPEQELIERLQGYDVLMSGFQTMTEAAYAQTNLTAFCACSIGVDFANPDAATRHGVVVTNNPDYCVDEVAEHAIALILHCARGLYKMVPYVKSGNWGFPILRPLRQFKSCTVGLYGFGRIPRLVAKKLAGMEPRIIACDPYVTQEQADPLGVTMVEFDGLLEQSDFLSLHAPLTASTKGVFNANAFARMKNTAYLINTARGPIVDQEALYRALRDEQIKGAALDVLEHEPPTPEDREIVSMPNVIVTGHSAFYSDDSLELQTTSTIDEILRVLAGKRPRNVVNKQVLEQIDWGRE